MRAAIGVVEVDDDVGRIEQHEQVLREISDGVDVEVRLAQEHRAGLRDGERCPDDGKVHIRQRPWRAHARDIAVARNLRHG